jgi:hypothetical protein
LLARAVIKRLDDKPIRIASIEHLIGMKQRGGRPRDLDDIAKLSQILNAPGS